MALPSRMQGDSWTPRTARLVMPLLVRRAQLGKPITYGELDAQVIRRGWGEHAFLVNYGWVAGAIGDALLETAEEWGITIPPLNAFVVNKHSGIPGSGCDYYIDRHVREEWQKDLSKAERAELVRRVHVDIRSFDRWDEILEDYGLESLPQDDGYGKLERRSGDADGAPSPDGMGGAESPEHRHLKEAIATDPSLVGLTAAWHGEIEHMFPSGDQVDVLLRSGRHALAVEVKAAGCGTGEQVRGVYQCIKYQALLQAEQVRDGLPPVGRAILAVGGPLSEAAAHAAEMLGVKVLANLA